MVGKSKHRRRTAEHYKNYPQLLRLLKNVNQKDSSSEEINRNCHVFANTVIAGHFYLLSYCLTADIWTFPVDV
jgi:hypothetical protein